MVEESSTTFFGLRFSKISHDEIILVVDFKQQFDESAFGLGVEHIPTGIFIEAINRSIKEKETFPCADRRFDEIFPLIEKNRQKFVFERSDIVVTDGQEVYHN